MTDTITAYATGPQAHFILTLQGMPKDDDNRDEAALAIIETMTKAEASALITQLKVTSKPVQAPVVPQVARGEWHVYGDAFYLVARSQGSGHLYAKRRNFSSGSFEFAPGIMKHLKPSTKVNANNIAVIRDYANLHNKCIFCNLPLDLPESRTAGYGKKCSENHNLPW